MQFKELNFKKWIIETLNELKINKLTDIQEKSIPLALKNNSLIVSSQTGSGKTYCYLLPILNNIDCSKNEIQAIIVLPTKELTRQVTSKINDFKKHNSSLRSCNLVELKNNSLNQNYLPHIVVGTPVKAFELVNKKAFSQNVKYFVLDEADMLFDLGFTNNIDEIFKKIDSNKLTKIACSATLHESLSNKLKKYLKNTKIILNSKSIWLNPNIKHNIVYSSNFEDFDGTLLKLTKAINPYFCIVFCNTKNEVNKIYEMFISNGLNAGMIHKDLSINERKKTFKEVNKNKYQYLIATDLVSRGLDITGADVVISYSMPKDDVWYIHRVGRCGRNNTNGTSFVIYNKQYDQQINRLSRKNIKWNFLLINKNNELINKNLRLRINSKPKFDSKTNAEIQKIIRVNSKKVKPGYKKKIKQQINKIKQKKKHEYIENQVKQRLLSSNIKRTKKNRFK